MYACVCASIWVRVRVRENLETSAICIVSVPLENICTPIYVRISSIHRNENEDGEEHAPKYNHYDEVFDGFTLH